MEDSLHKHVRRNTFINSKSQYCVRHLTCTENNYGVPVSMAPFGIFAPRSMYCWGFFKKLTNSIISSFASSQPATSLTTEKPLKNILEDSNLKMKYC